MVGYFEISVTDLDRAISFYEQVFGVSLTTGEIDGHLMAFFPDAEQPGRITGALAVGESYVPSTNGSLIYFAVDEMAPVLERVVAAGGSIAYPMTDIGEYGYVAEFQDSEGNRIGLNAPS